MSKYQRYPKYKDSGVEWLGKVPEHWNNYRIDWINTIVRGNTAFKKDELLDNGEYVALQYGKTYKVDEVNDTFKFYVNSEFYKYSQVVHHGDTILISTSETIEDLGHSCFYNRDDLGLIGGEQILLKPNTELIHKKYLYYSSKVFCSGLKRYATGLKVFRFNIDDLKNIFISVPLLKEQQTIANYLDKATAKIDTLIKKQTKLIALLKEKRQAVISTAVTRGLDNSVLMKESGVEWLEEIPEGWEAMKLKFISTVNDDTLPENTSDDLEIKYIDIGSVTTGYIQNYEKMSYSDAPSRARRIIKSGDILVSTVRTYLKAIAPVSVKFDNYIASTGFAVIRSGDELDSNFTKYALLSNYFIDLVESRSVGVSYPAINASDLITFSIAIPSTQEQQTIAQYLDDKTMKIDNLITKATKAIDLLKERRTALISAVVTGKIDVRGEEK